MIRDDLSDKLIHLVRGETVDEAFHKFVSILKEGALRGGDGYIKGSYKCVCFTETPLAKLGHVFASPDLEKMRYRPFGIMVDKNYAFDQGARPVIYQPDSDFVKLDEEIRYRHVRFEPTNPAYPIDLTWEREWRIKTDALHLPQDTTTVVVPNRVFRDALVEHHSEDLRHTVSSLGDSAALAIEPYPWNIVVLEDLGMKIPDGL